MLKLQFEKGAVKNPRTELFESSVKYFNNKGADLYNEMKPMIKLNQKDVPQSLENFLFHLLSLDAQAVFKKPPMGHEKAHVPYPDGITFEFGRSGSHFWVHENNTRVLIVTFENI